MRQYTNEELSEKHDEMSLVMLINKIQTDEDLSEFRKVSEEMVDSIYGNAPDEIKDVSKEISFCCLNDSKTIFFMPEYARESTSGTFSVL